MAKTKKIHHATAKRAAKLGFALELHGDNFAVKPIDGGHILAIEATVNEALEKAQTDPMPLPGSGSVVKAKYKKRYGKKANCGDAMAEAVTAYVVTDDGSIDLGLLHTVARDNGLDPARWEHLNIGQQSMNIRNCLRGMLRRRERAVVVGAQTFEPPAEESEDNAEAEAA